MELTVKISISNLGHEPRLKLYNHLINCKKNTMKYFAMMVFIKTNKIFSAKQEKKKRFRSKETISHLWWSYIWMELIRLMLLLQLFLKLAHVLGILIKLPLLLWCETEKKRSKKKKKADRLTFHNKIENIELPQVYVQHLLNVLFKNKKCQKKSTPTKVGSLINHFQQALNKTQPFNLEKNDNYTYL